ncbi:Oxygen-dependent choline dehydrogenase, partial [Clarias magur]
KLGDAKMTSYLSIAGTRCDVLHNVDCYHPSMAVVMGTDHLGIIEQVSVPYQCFSNITELEKR